MRIIPLNLPDVRGRSAATWDLGWSAPVQLVPNSTWMSTMMGKNKEIVSWNYNMQDHELKVPRTFLPTAAKKKKVDQLSPHLVLTPQRLQHSFWLHLDGWHRR